MYKLKPIVHPQVAALMNKVDLLFKATDDHGSPLNILFPEVMPENVAGFNAVLEKHDLQGRIFFARKPNKSSVFARVAEKAGLNIDVASVRELEGALAAGFSPDRIEATGPKPMSFLHMAVREGVIINVDSFYELETIARLSQSIKKKTKILIRLSNFVSSSIQIAPRLERFGIEYAKLEEIFPILTLNADSLSPIGFSFHINNSSLEERVVAFEGIFRALLRARALGFQDCSVLNIGGGFQANYLQDKEQWREFLLKLKEYVEGKNGERLSFTGSKFGYYYDGQAVKGNYTFQDFYNPVAKEVFLDRLLSTKLPEFENRSIGQLVMENLCELWLEPGQGLLDQCGVTVARVIGVKEVSGEKVIFTEMNYTNLDADRYELFTDPVLLKKNSGVGVLDPRGYFISGDLCLSIDMIANHKVYLDYSPEPDDLLVFINTAAYRMDFVEAETLQNPVAGKRVWNGTNLVDQEDYLSLNKRN